jgi:hypothetical protein
MKRIFNLSIFMLVFGVALSGCKKDNDDDNNPDNNNQQFELGTGELKCTVNGTTFEANLEYCLFADGTLNLGNFLENNAQLQFTPAAVGTFEMNFGGQGTQDVLFLVMTNGTSLSATSATITISELDGTTSGTFTATCTDVATGDTYTVTNGSFSANLF